MESVMSGIRRVVVYDPLRCPFWECGASASGCGVWYVSELARVGEMLSGDGSHVGCVYENETVVALRPD